MVTSVLVGYVKERERETAGGSCSGHSLFFVSAGHTLEIYLGNVS